MTKYHSETIIHCAFCPSLCLHACPLVVGESKETFAPSTTMGLINMWQKNRLSLNKDIAHIFYACTNCAACTAYCKHDLRPQEILYASRQDLLNEKLTPQPILDIIENYNKSGNPYNITQSLKEGTKAKNNDEIVLLAGFELFRNAPEQPYKLLDALRKITGKSVNLLPTHVSSGELLYAAGALNEHKLHAKKLTQQLQTHKTIVVAEPSTAQHLQGYQTYTGIEFKPKILHFIEAFGDWKPLKKTTSTQKLAFYHDHPSLGRFSGIYDRPRELIEQLGYQIIEFSRNRYLASGTGSGGLYKWISPEGAKKSAQWLLRELYEYQERHNLSSPPALITVGEIERAHLAKSDPNLTILDLNQLLAQSIL